MRLLILASLCLALGGCAGGILGDRDFARTASYRGCVQFNDADRCPSPDPTLGMGGGETPQPLPTILPSPVKKAPL